MLKPIESNPEPSRDEQVHRDAIAEMTRRLELVRDLPRLDRFRQTHELPQAFFEHFDAFLEAYDRLIDYVLAYDGDNERIQCKKGCANCCIDLVRGLTTPEIINIYRFVREWPDAREVFNYHRESAELFMRIVASQLEPGEPPPSGRDPRIAQAHVEFNRQNRPCGFLDQATGCCRIYPVRPIACRYFFSFDEPRTCSPLHVLYLKRRTRTIHLPESIHALLREIDHAFGFRPLNYLSGGFCQFAAEVMHTRPVRVTNDAGPPPAE